MNPSDGQLRAAHIILRYKPISTAFQAPKCVIKAKDPRLHRISVAFEGFIVPEGVPIPEGTPFTQPLPVAAVSVWASSSRSVLQEVKEEEEKEGEEEKEEVVELLDSADEFEVSTNPNLPR